MYMMEWVTCPNTYAQTLIYKYIDTWVNDFLRLKIRGNQDTDTYGQRSM